MQNAAEWGIKCFGTGNSMLRVVKTDVETKTIPKKHHSIGCFFGIVVSICMNSNPPMRLV